MKGLARTMETAGESVPVLMQGLGRAARSAATVMVRRVGPRRLEGAA